MSHVIRRNAVAWIALFVALSGTGYAATSLPRNSVGHRQLRSSAVTSANVRDGSLRPSDFRRGSLPTGARGPAGERGPAGAPGSARAFAHILLESGTGQVDDQRSSGIAAANISRKFQGVVCISGLGFTPRSAVATADATSAAGVTVAQVGLAPDRDVLNTCGGAGQVAVLLTNLTTEKNVDASFYVMVS